MSAPEYLAFVEHMNRELRERERAARKASKTRR